MRLLAWDTSSKAGALCAIQVQDAHSTPELVSEWALNVDATHSERLLWAIDELLEASRWKLEDIDIFAVGVGPGSFTGLRIGVATARTLAHSLKKPLIGISSLAALARPTAEWAIQKSKDTLIVASTDACKGELFALWGGASAVRNCVAVADEASPGLWKRGVEEEVVRPEDLVKSLKKKLSKAGTRWIAVGEGRNRYDDVWKTLPAAKELPAPIPFSSQIQGRYVGLLALEAYRAGLALDPLTIHPRYVRVADAELKLKAGLLPPGPTRGHP